MPPTMDDGCCMPDKSTFEFQQDDDMISVSDGEEDSDYSVVDDEIECLDFPGSSTTVNITKEGEQCDEDAKFGIVFDSVVFGVFSNRSECVEELPAEELPAEEKEPVVDAAEELAVADDTDNAPVDVLDCVEDDGGASAEEKHEDIRHMSVVQLRQLVTERGLSSNAAKLRKPDLIKLLE